MKKPKFTVVKRPDGSSEFYDFLGKLPAKDEAKLLATIEKVEEKGLLVATRQEWVKKLGDNLFELRAKVGSNIQRGVYFHWENENYVITHGFTKKTDKTPKKEINHGRKVRDRFLNERRNNYE